jgi:hypothetical protein
MGEQKSEYDIGLLIATGSLLVLIIGFIIFILFNPITLLIGVILIVCYFLGIYISNNSNK